MDTSSTWDVCFWNELKEVHWRLLEGQLLREAWKSEEFGWEYVMSLRYCKSFRVTVLHRPSFWITLL